MMNSSINSTSTYTPGPGLFYEDHEPEFEVYNLDLVQMSPGDFNVDSSYHSLDPIGRGSYGVVCSALDLQTGKRVAIKKISSIRNQMMALRTLREIRILRYLRSHENIIGINKVTLFNEEVYIIQPLVDSDLHHMLCIRNFNDFEAAFIMHQLFRGLKYLHSAQIIHRDIKPSNILINKQNQIKICDFGLARVYNDAEENDQFGMTEYVATRYYRAPEVMIASKKYDKAIDVWSAGCVLAELMSKNPTTRILFPGRHYMHMLQLMISLLGTPTNNDISYVHNPKARSFIIKQDKATRVDWCTLFPYSSWEACNLLDKIMTFNPSVRITVNGALHHPFLRAYVSNVRDYKFYEPLYFEENFYNLSSGQAKELLAREARLIAGETGQ